MASQSNATYAVFIYKCGLLRKTIFGAFVGFNSDFEYYNHPLSETSNITDIDCEDAVSEWTNIVYKIDQGNYFLIMNIMYATVRILHK